MAKTLATAKQIKDEINRRIQTSNIQAFYKKLRISMPRQAIPAERGVNWHVDNLQASIATEGQIPQRVIDEISRIVAEVQAMFDCSDW